MPLSKHTPPRPKFFNMRLTAAEWATIDAAACVNGLAPSVWARNQLRMGAIDALRRAGKPVPVLEEAKS